MGDPGGEAVAKSERATKINERSVAKQMPLMGEFLDMANGRLMRRDGP